MIKIKELKNGTELTNQFLEFVKNCSWEECKDHIADMIQNWNFTDWERMFVAICDGKIVGMTSIMKSDYYPLPKIYPWISCVFVSEENRGNRISEKLIDYANDYAKSIGFNKTYISSNFMGLYEKYGYNYVKDIMNYSNTIDRLYAKNI